MRDAFYIVPIKKHKSEKGLQCRRGIEDKAVDCGRVVEYGDFDYSINGDLTRGLLCRDNHYSSATAIIPMGSQGASPRHPGPPDRSGVSGKFC